MEESLSSLCVHTSKTCPSHLLSRSEVLKLKMMELELAGLHVHD
jgi:hypothetical protein